MASGAGGYQYNYWTLPRQGPLIKARLPRQGPLIEARLACEGADNARPGQGTAHPLADGSGSLCWAAERQEAQRWKAAFRKCSPKLSFRSSGTCPSRPLPSQPHPPLTHPFSPLSSQLDPTLPPFPPPHPQTHHLSTLSASAKSITTSISTPSTDPPLLHSHPGKIDAFTILPQPILLPTSTALTNVYLQPCAVLPPSMLKRNSSSVLSNRSGVLHFFMVCAGFSKSNKSLFPLLCTCRK